MSDKDKTYQRRPVISKTPNEPKEHQVNFQPWRFNSLIDDKAYNVWIDKAYRCPCSVKGSGQPLPSCRNCLGTGWIFTNRKETRVAIQSINIDIKYDNWLKNVAGTVRVTARAVDRLAFMDRIILREVDGFYNEILRIKEVDNKLFLFPEYPILEIEELMKFEGDNVALSYMKEGIDFKVNDESEIEILNSSITINDTFTIRYRHRMTYHIIEMNRDVMKVRDGDQDACNFNQDKLANMPINGIARKAHYLFDNLKYEEKTKLLDNTKL